MRAQQKNKKDGEEDGTREQGGTVRRRVFEVVGEISEKRTLTFA